MLSDEQHVQLETMLQALEPELKEIYPNGQNFVRDQIERFAKYGQDTRISPKQWNWLTKLYEEFAEQPEAAPVARAPDELDDDTVPF